MPILTSVVLTDSEEFGTAQTYRVTDGQTDRVAYAINKMDGYQLVRSPKRVIYH